MVCQQHAAGAGADEGETCPFRRCGMMYASNRASTAIAPIRSITYRRPTWRPTLGLRATNLISGLDGAVGKTAGCVEHNDEKNGRLPALDHAGSPSRAPRDLSTASRPIHADRSRDSGSTETSQLVIGNSRANEGAFKARSGTPAPVTANDYVDLGPADCGESGPG